MAKLKVFGGHTFARIDGKMIQASCIMATTSQKKFTAATGITRDYMAQTRNKVDIATATEYPETLFVNQNGNNYPRVWIKSK